MLAFKIRYRPVERGQPRKIELVPVWQSDMPTRPVASADGAVAPEAPTGEPATPPSVH